eukprot:gene9870-10916_t
MENQNIAFDQNLEDFRMKIAAQCEKYRSATQKDKAKHSQLVNSLEKDFGDKISIAKYLEDVKQETLYAHIQE